MSIKLSKLETQLRSDLVKLISLKAQNAVYDAANSVFEFDNPENWSQAYAKPGEVEALVKKSKELFIHCETAIINKNMDGLPEKIGLVRADLIAFTSPLFLYTMALDPLNEHVTDMLERLGEPSGEDKKINGAHLVNDCMDFIRGAAEESMDDLPSYMEEIITCFPLRMTKEKYYDYVRKSLEYMFKDISAENAALLLQNLKTRFYAANHPDFGKFFPEIYETVKELQARDFMLMNKEELEAYQEDIDFCISDVYEIIDYLNLVNEYLWNVQFLAGIPEPWNILEENFICMDIFRAAANALLSGDHEYIADSLRDRIEDNQGEVFEQILELRSKVADAVDKFGDTAPSESTIKMLLISEFHEMLALRGLDEEAYPLDFSGAENSPDPDERRKMAEELTGYMAETLNGMGIKLQKIYRAFFMKNLPCMMSVDELSNYLNFSIENSDNHDKVITAMKAIDVFKAYGYFDDEHEDCDDPNCGHEHHHH